MPQPALDTHAEVRKLKQAGCPEEQAEAMVDLVGRAPLNAQIARSLEQVQFRLDSIESNMAGLATQSSLEALALRVESIESTMATRKDLEVLVRISETGLLPGQSTYIAGRLPGRKSCAYWPHLPLPHHKPLL